MKSKHILTIMIAIILIVGAFFLYKSFKTPTSGPQEMTLETDSSEVTMHMGNNSYTPVNLKIKKGTKVRFVNESKDYRWPASDLHPSHLIFPDFDVKRAMSPGEEWSYTFEKVGEWGYHDHLAPYITGTIIVVEN